MSDPVGLIGLGVLGSAIAERLIGSGFEVIGYDVVAEKCTALQQKGLRAAQSVYALAERTNVVITSLPTAPALHEVAAGAEGLAQCRGRNHTVIETSTFAIADKEKARDALAQAGKTLLDCPVSGNRIQALRGELTAFASGERAAYDKVGHVIDGFTRKSHYVGAFGNGSRMKFCANILNLVHNSVAAEVMVLGMKSGLDPKLVHEVISGSASSSRMFEVRGAMMAQGKYDVEGMNFSIPLKDSRIISDHAADLLCPIPIYQAALQPYYAAVAQGHGGEDAAAVCAALELAANCRREQGD